MRGQQFVLTFAACLCGAGLGLVEAGEGKGGWRALFDGKNLDGWQNGQGKAPGAGWVLGVGRYSEGILEWFRFFSYSLRPRMVFPRRNVRVLETRMPDPVEAVALNTDEKVLRIEVHNGRAETE